MLKKKVTMTNNVNNMRRRYKKKEIMHDPKKSKNEASKYLKASKNRKMNKHEIEKLKNQ